MASSIFKKDLTLSVQPINGLTKILANNITFTEEELSPGGSGSMRIWIALITQGDVDATLDITYNGTFSEDIRLSAENSFAIKSRGLYRFDVPIRAGIIFNIRANIQVLSVELLFLDKIVFGA